VSDVACVILAAGAGRRFGGPKQLAVLHGRPLLAHVAELAAPWDPVVVLGAHADEVRAAVPEGTRVVVCEEWSEGQAASLRAGVAAVGGAHWALVLLADQPLLTRAAIEGVLAARDCGSDAVRATYGGTPGHPVVLGRRVLDAVPSLRGDTGARELLSRFTVRTWEAGHLCDPTDIDTPGQLEEVALR
jgi:CTP:molybdopterin cytidylyltransferase MocA